MAATSPDVVVPVEKHDAHPEAREVGGAVVTVLPMVMVPDKKPYVPAGQIVQTLPWLAELAVL